MGRLNRTSHMPVSKSGLEGSREYILWDKNLQMFSFIFLSVWVGTQSKGPAVSRERSSLGKLTCHPMSPNKQMTCKLEYHLMEFLKSRIQDWWNCLDFSQYPLQDKTMRNLSQLLLGTETLFHMLCVHALSRTGFWVTFHQYCYCQAQGKFPNFNKLNYTKLSFNITDTLTETSKTHTQKILGHPFSNFCSSPESTHNH